MYYDSYLTFKNIKNTNIYGFSLIELSIVLIIIGLLVAGVTGGQSLIESAKQRSFITELRNWDVAVNTFYAAKGKLPADTNNDGDFGQYSGDNYNGYFPASYNGSVYAVPNEFMAPFIDLYLNSIIDFKPEYNNDNQHSKLPTSNALQNMSRYYFVAMRARQQDIKIGKYAYLNGIKDNIVLLSFNNSNSKYKTKFAKDIDNKLDNNNAYTGKLRVQLVNDDNVDITEEDNYELLDNNYKIKFIGYDITQ